MKTQRELAEQAILSQYRPYLMGRVNTFLCKGNGRCNAVLSQQDLLQEASIWFLNEYRQGGLEAALTHRLSLHRALYDAVRRAYQISMPYGVYRTRPKDVNRFVPSDASAESCPVTGWYSMEDDVIFHADVSSAIARFSGEEQEMLRMKANGMTQREIARHIGVSQAYVCRAFKDMRKRIRTYLH